MAALGAFVCVLVLLCAPGCKSKPKPTDLTKELITARWVEPDLPPESYLELDKAMVDGLAVALGEKKRPDVRPGTIKPLNLLALSAGGKYGAYTAGVLAGWQASGARPPHFDVVTGVSSGAVIAIYAFLGPHYDDTVKKFFTETTSKDMFRYRPARDLIRYGSVATAEPLKAIIEREINKCVLDEIRAGHAAGRRLYICTLNIQSKRAAIWDIGAILCSGRPDADDLVRKILLAACSIPGMVPPIEFDVVVDGKHYKEKHSDGGAVTQIYMKLANDQATAMPGAKWLEGSNLFILAAGKFYSDPSDARMNLLGRVGASLSASLYSLYRAELCKLYALSLCSGLSYNIIALEQTVPVKDPRSIDFDPETMKMLYEAGFQQACQGVPWRKVPPGGLSGEEETPRAGTCFITLPQLP